MRDKYSPENSRESKEGLDYSLSIIIHRHGEKGSLAGGLSERGKTDSANFFEHAYRGVAPNLPEAREVEIEHSPIDRTTQTAMISDEYSDRTVTSVKEEERLSEGMVAHHKELIEEWGGVGGRWITPWMSLKERPLPDVKTGQEVVKDFTTWLLEKINGQKEKGGSKEIDAFSHYPVMISFLLTLEQKMGIELLPKDWQKESNAIKIINYLDSFNLYTDSKDDKTLHFNFRNKNIDIPLEILESIANPELDGETSDEMSN